MDGSAILFLLIIPLGFKLYPHIVDGIKETEKLKSMIELSKFKNKGIVSNLESLAEKNNMSLGDYILQSSEDDLLGR